MAIFILCGYTYVGAARFVRISLPQPGVELSYITSPGEPEGDAGDPYNGYDRFGRTESMNWKESAS